MDAPLRIHDLRDRPDLLDTVAERIWRAFWQHKGSALDDLRASFARHLAPGDLPLTLVAMRDGLFRGTVSLIQCDEPERSDLAPWLAALWVDEAVRGQGIGAALVSAVERRCAALGIAHVYLSAKPAVAPFYAARGWQTIDAGVGPARLAIMEKQIDGKIVG